MTSDHSALIERLEAAEFRGPMQHLRDWSELDRLLAEAAAALREIEGERSVEYVIYQDDVMVAGSDDEADIRHYAFVYGQDGPVDVFKVVSFSSPLPSAPNQAKEAGE